MEERRTNHRSGRFIIFRLIYNLEGEKSTCSVRFFTYACQLRKIEDRAISDF